VLPLVAFRQQEKLNRFCKKLSIAIQAKTTPPFGHPSKGGEPQNNIAAPLF
jgi:hypothetical protein